MDGLVLKNLVLEALQQCMAVSLRVLDVTSDMGACKRAMRWQMNFSSHRNSEVVSFMPHPCLKDTKLYFIADPADVLKNIRGQLINSRTFTLRDDPVASSGLSGSKMDIEHAPAVIDSDALNEFKCAPRLSSVHVSGGRFTKIKVGVAVKLLKESPPGIPHLVELGVIGKEAEATAWFMKLISKWFTLVSSSHLTLALRKLDTAKPREVLEMVELTVTTIRGIKIGGNSHWKPSQAGVITSTNDVVML